MRDRKEIEKEGESTGANNTAHKREMEVLLDIRDLLNSKPKTTKK